MSLNAIQTVLQAALLLVTTVLANPSSSIAQKQQAITVAQSAVTVANQALQTTPLPTPLPPPGPPPPGNSAGISFTRSYNGAATGNQNRKWSWQPNVGTSPTNYYVQPSWTAAFYTTNTTYRFADTGQYRDDQPPHTGSFPEGAYTLSVQAVGPSGLQAPIADTFKVSYYNPLNRQPTHEMGVGILGDYEDAQHQLHNVVGMRYTFRVDEDTTTQGIKILFSSHQLKGPQGSRYSLEDDIFTHRFTYADPVCDHRGPLLGTPIYGEGGLWVDLSDLVADSIGKQQTGIKTFSPSMFPRQVNLGIDDGAGTGSSLSNRREMIAQANLTGKDVQIEITRGAIITDKTGWKCNATLDSDTYREWDESVTFDGTTHTIAFAVPDAVGQYFVPGQLLQPVTEFFNFPGYYRVYYWNVQAQQENETAWRTVNTYQVKSFDGYTVDYGVKKSTYHGNTVLEMSNDAPNSYFPEGAVFSLDSSVVTLPPPPAPPSPSSVYFLSPQATIVLTRGQTYRVVWGIVPGPTGNTTVATLDIQPSDKSAPAMAIGAVTPGKGYYDWVVPSSLPASPTGKYIFHLVFSNSAYFNGTVVSQPFSISLGVGMSSVRDQLGSVISGLQSVLDQLSVTLGIRP